MSADAATTSRIVWLSDLHFDASDRVLGHDPRARLDAAIDYVNAHYGDARLCVISGDMVETASAKNYATLRQSLDRLCLPWHPMTGNHDSRALLRTHLPLPETAMPDFVQYEIALPQARLLCLDTLMEGSGKGVLCQTRLDWLRERLAAPDDGRPIIIFMHHPPMALGLPMLDPMRLENGETLLRILRATPAVRQLCFGHIHRPVAGSIQGMAYCGLRSVLYQAPPPRPDWTWDTFAPAHEAPELGVITLDDGRVMVQTLAFCPAGFGVASV
ncbi:phosphodiesterase [Roseovarius pelagicus]|uniref:Phosphodiesterase n=1 Tax=Roseovarius pelagicus TaxID=2980108 RepID=A0ABY6DBJ5_9RHOB|nr:phosphodiesterase [Roseovarius pelagicus]UXX83244.1 phosphodiesterase [Roseovarius pelagicus]